MPCSTDVSTLAARKRLGLSVHCGVTCSGVRGPAAAELPALPADSGDGVALTALKMLSRPPVTVLPWRSGTGSTLSRITALTSAKLRVGLTERIRAAVPATNGVAAEQPPNVPLAVVQMSVPGAPRSTATSPKLEKLARIAHLTPREISKRDECRGRRFEPPRWGWPRALRTGAAGLGWPRWSLRPFSRRLLR